MALSCPFCHMRLAPLPQLLVGASGCGNTEAPAEVGQEMGLPSLLAASAKVTDGSQGWGLGCGVVVVIPLSRLCHTLPLCHLDTEALLLTLYLSEAHGRRVASAASYVNISEATHHSSLVQLSAGMLKPPSLLIRPNLQLPAPRLYPCPVRHR